MFKGKLSGLSLEYATALKAHLRPGAAPGLAAARALGLKVAAAGLNTLALARMHQRCLVALGSAAAGVRRVARARVFFGGVMVPLEAQQTGAVKAGARLDALHLELGGRGVDLAASQELLKEGIARRKEAQSALSKSERRSRKLLHESQRLQKHLQTLTHRILAAQEAKRGKISLTLQDEVAQTLLGINLRLLSLKQEAGRNAEGLRREIAATRQMVEASLKSIHRFAQSFGKRNET